LANIELVLKRLTNLFLGNFLFAMVVFVTGSFPF